jgi:hypothetical protein
MLPQTTAIIVVKRAERAFSVLCGTVVVCQNE